MAVRYRCRTSALGRDLPVDLWALSPCLSDYAEAVALQDGSVLSSGGEVLGASAIWNS